MSTIAVWAPKNDPTLGSWRENPATGWSHLVYFDTFDDLLHKLLGNGELKGKVDILGLVAHGQPGAVDLGVELSVENLGSWDGRWKDLRRVLRRQAVLTFYSCNAAVGNPGTQLLQALSIRLPDRWVVGFTVFGIANTMLGYPGTMGYNVRNDGTTSLGHLDPSVPYVKVVRNGAIVRWPSGEGPPSSAMAWGSAVGGGVQR